MQMGVMPGRSPITVIAHNLRRAVRMHQEHSPTDVIQAILVHVFRSPVMSIVEVGQETVLPMSPGHSVLLVQMSMASIVTKTAGLANDNSTVARTEAQVQKCDPKSLMTPHQVSDNLKLLQILKN